MTFRYHVVSLLAVLMALAVGVVLGSGPLLGQEPVTETVDADSGAQEQADQQVEDLSNRLGYEQGYAEATAPKLVTDRLAGRALTVVALPGAQARTVTDVAATVATAGGTVSAQIQVREELLDIGNRQLVTELAGQVGDSADGQLDAPSGATGYQRLGRLLARAVASTQDGGERIDPLGQRILTAMTTAELIATSEPIDRRGSLVVLVAGAPYGSRDAREGAGSIVAALAAALDAGSDGAVLAGPPAAAAQDGVLAAVRADPTATQDVSTVDTADEASGEVVAILALEEQVAGESGHYGVQGADGPLPDVPAR